MPHPQSADDRLDAEFVSMLTQIENYYQSLSKHIQIRIQKWVQVLIQCDQTTYWRKNRNNYMSLLHQMVLRGKVQGIFTKMPDKELPSMTDSDYHRFIKEYGLEKRKGKEVDFSLRRVEEAKGDFGSGVASPDCLTDRTIEKQKSEQNCQKISCIKSEIPTSIEKPEISQDLVCKIFFLMQRHQITFQEDEDYLSIMQDFYDNLAEVTEVQMQQQQSSELKVEQGIEVNKANLFQFGSPRGMTQMQYFKAALQL